MNTKPEPHKPFEMNNKTLLLGLIALMVVVLSIGTITTIGGWGNFTIGINTPLVNATHVYDNYSVEYYGAKGDGITDDTAAIQTAFNSVPMVKFDAKTYAFTHLTYPGTLQVVQGVTKGSTVTVLNGTSNVKELINTSETIRTGGYDWRDLVIRNGTTNNAQTCLNVSSSSFNIRNIQVFNCGYAINVTNMDFSTWQDVTARGSINGLTINPISSVNLNTFIQVNTRGTTGWATNISSGTGSTEQNTFINLNADTSANGIWNGVGTVSTFMNPWTESITGGGYSIRNDDKSGTIITNPHNGDGQASTPISLGSGTMIAGNGIYIGCRAANSQNCTALFLDESIALNASYYISDISYGVATWKIAYYVNKTGYVSFNGGHN